MHDLNEIVETIRVSDLDMVFISYDEPNCEENWHRNLRVIPWLKRVHGVKGFDAAHKAAARLCRTDRIVTIDGDTTVDPEFLNKTLNVRAGIRDYTFSWKSVNPLHGLCYGNGSLKCWKRSAMLGMRTHEIAVDERTQVDFCWTVPTVGMKSVFSITDSARSPFQAFRSGFREGVKITLDEGRPIPPEQIKNRAWKDAIYYLRVWCTVGADHPYGLWSIYGARLGLRMMMDYPNPEYRNIADYGWFPEEFRKRALEVGGKVDIIRLHDSFSYDKEGLVEKIQDLAVPIRERSDIDLCLFDPAQSKMVKSLMAQPEKWFDPMVEG